MSKKYNDELVRIDAEITCGKCGTTFKSIVDAYDFNFGEQECELCGSHGHLLIKNQICPYCKRKMSELIINDW